MENRAFSLVKPTIQTNFHIDFDWWKEHDGNWRVYLIDYLCDEHRAMFENENQTTLMDFVDPDTGEVHPIDGIQEKLMVHCSKQTGFVEENHSLVDNIFRVFLANGNTPLSAEELSALTGKPAGTILKLLSGQRIFMGIRPIQM